MLFMLLLGLKSWQWKGEDGVVRRLVEGVVWIEGRGGGDRLGLCLGGGGCLGLC